MVMRPRRRRGSGTPISSMSITSVRPSQCNALGPTRNVDAVRSTVLRGRSAIAHRPPGP